MRTMESVTAHEDHDEGPETPDEQVKSACESAEEFVVESAESLDPFEELLECSRSLCSLCGTRFE